MTILDEGDDAPACLRRGQRLRVEALQAFGFVLGQRDDHAVRVRRAAVSELAASVDVRGARQLAALRYAAERA